MFVFHSALHWVVCLPYIVDRALIRVFKAGFYALKSIAWDHEIGPSFMFVDFGLRVMINRGGRGCTDSVARGEILGPTEDELKRKHSPRTYPLIKNER